MDTKEFVRDVALKLYQSCKDDPADFSKLFSAVNTMNTVAEQVALERLGYGNVTRQEIDAKSNDVRQQFPELQSIKQCSEALKHVRRHGRGQLTTSTTEYCRVTQPRGCCEMVRRFTS